jgi:hypothetical protein
MCGSVQQPLAGIQPPSTAVGNGVRIVRVHWTLRLAVVACFLGYGAFGIITKKGWLPYFGVWGIAAGWLALHGLPGAEPLGRGGEQSPRK